MTIYFTINHRSFFRQLQFAEQIDRNVLWNFFHFCSGRKTQEGDHMPRRPRVHSHSNIYHVCLRGINQQQIFYDKEDYRYFLKVLEKYKEPSGYMIHAYCLMGNHIHLLIQTGAESLETVFKRIG
ncbi:MAG: transposase, partial [Lachnospiraceae bacterium]|nr:transposase [Lachnospiraceae bacterium]